VYTGVTIVSNINCQCFCTLKLTTRNKDEETMMMKTAE